MVWRDAVAAALPRPAIRRDADGTEWRCYLDGSVDRVSEDGRSRRMRRVRPEAWVDWEAEERP